jgi:hypothetical protein
MDTVQRACEIAAAAMEWDWQPEYNGEHVLVPPPAQAIRPAIQALADAGLLAPRERYASLDQLAPGDRIWLDGAWREVADAGTHDSDIRVLAGAGDDFTDFTAPAALLVRRAEP